VPSPPFRLWKMGVDDAPDRPNRPATLSPVENQRIAIQTSHQTPLQRRLPLIVHGPLIACCLQFPPFVMYPPLQQVVENMWHEAAPLFADGVADFRNLRVGTARTTNRFR